MRRSRDGKPSPLSDLPIQYADYAVWQRQWLQGEVLEQPAIILEEAVGGDSCGTESADGSAAAGGAEFSGESDNRSSYREN